MGARLLPLFGTLLLAAVLAAGCSKRQPAKGDANDSRADAAAAAPAAPTRGPGPVTVPTAGAVIADSADVNATLTALSSELRKYVIGTRSVPKDFEDFIGNSHVQAPPAPAGKKYAIKNQAVVLVKR